MTGRVRASASCFMPPTPADTKAFDTLLEETKLDRFRDVLQQAQISTVAAVAACDESTLQSITNKLIARKLKRAALAPVGTAAVSTVTAPAYRDSSTNMSSTTMGKRTQKTKQSAPKSARSSSTDVRVGNTTSEKSYTNQPHQQQFVYVEASHNSSSEQFA